jgi:hypothetical protein
MADRVFLVIIVAVMTTVSALLSGTPAYAFGSHEISVQDTRGVTRAQGTVDDHARIEFTIQKANGTAPDNVEVTLTNSATMGVLSSMSANGLVAFDQVAPGTWVVATASPGITFTQVNIVSMGATVAPTTGKMSLLGKSLILGGAAVGVTGIVLGVRSDDNDKPLSPSS